MLKIELNCAQCNALFKLAAKEYRRQVKRGRQLFFCSRSCGAVHANSLRDGRVTATSVACVYCGKPFLSDTSARAAKHCSHACANRGNVTPRRRIAARAAGLVNIKNNMTVHTRAAGLATREGWKYAAIRKYLNSIGEPCSIEFPLRNSIYDLALPRLKTLVEFDGPEHSSVRGVIKDRFKQTVAANNGWSIRRVKVTPNSVICPIVCCQIL